ncbi:GrpB domain, predicted nucleotidyltransferase, UPF0157 family [Sinosporangium album]|uniref:GrpB domain, predicted nucleotidyltransferase, UPF0157 family n=1 Tax=Sinosporangium album TaxID=504805 RepID=A0A1G8GVG4_9ACTN|nr:GrpB family protein [Sinosporangium album]SDH98416.1 GrpB domain, predicted nucleotidyltransferase, UPF0157 family [Sinosporangium album]
MPEQGKNIPRTSMREEEIEAAHIEGPPRIDGNVFIADYDLEWPAHYEREAARVRSALGIDVLRLEHVGSTSVPGLPAKPVIDMLLVLRDSADEPAYVPSMERAGFVLAIREPDWYEHRVFRRPGADPAVTLHVLSAGCPEIERMLGFRDHLRRHEADRDLYARVKRDLAGREWKYLQNYADAKTEVVEEILRRALGGQAL